MLSCQAVGGRQQDAIHTASIIELFHNFTLIHDDIEDGSEMRRGKPCVHKVYGVPVTINSGDGMLLYTLKALESTTPEIRASLYESFIQVLNGQGMELGWIAKKEQGIREADYMRMVSMKTGALISAACETGGILGGGSRQQVAALKNFGMAVGVAFQMQDDILNLVGEEKVYKKEIGGDITEGKRTLMTIHALETASRKEREELSTILNSNTPDQARIRRAIEIIRGTGSVEYTKGKASGAVKSAKEKLSILPKNASTERLLKLADFLISREF